MRLRIAVALGFLATACAPETTTTGPVREDHAPVVGDTGMLGSTYPANMLALSYDDGPDVSTLPIARYLHDQGISATFFVVGCRFQGQDPGIGWSDQCDGVQYPESILDELVALGHRIGNHGLHHLDLAYQASIGAGDAIYEELIRTQAILDRHITDGVYVIRAPYFQWAGVGPYVRQHHDLDKLVGPWSADIDGQDWACAGQGMAPEACAQEYVSIINGRPAHNGIVLLHDREQGAPGTDYALRLTQALVTALRADTSRTYAFQTLGAAAPLLGGVTVAPATVASGGSASGTIYLSALAPAGGATVALLSSNPSAVALPQSVTVPAGLSTAIFPVTALTVTAPTTVTVSGSLAGTTVGATLTVTPPPSDAVSVSPAALIGGATAVGTVTLRSPAPAGGTVASLSSSAPAVVAVPATVTVAAGATTATFTAATSPVSSATPVTLTATIDGTARTTTLTVNPGPGGSNLLRSATAIGNVDWPYWGGGLAVTLNYAIAPDGTRTASRVTVPGVLGHALSQGVAVTPGTRYVFSFWARNNGGLAAAYSVYDVSNGRELVAPTSYFSQITGSAWTQISVPFTAPSGCTRINVYPERDSGAATNVLLWGADLEVAAQALAGVSVAPATVAGGVGSIGTVTLTGASPSGGTTVALSSSDPAVATVPSTVTVPGGATTATFPVTTTPVTAATAVTVSATLASVTRTTTLTVGPPPPDTFSVSPAVVVGGAAAQGALTLGSPAPAGGTPVAFTSSDPAVASVPANLTVVPGATTVTLGIVTSSVASTTTVTITATVNGRALPATLTVNPPAAPATNLLQSPDAIGGAGWAYWGGGIAVTLDAATAPDATQHASRVVVPFQAGHALAQSVTVLPATRYVLSFYARNNGGAAAAYSVYDLTHRAELVAPTSYFAQISSTGWTRITLPFTTPAGCTSVNVYPVRDSPGPVDVLVWGAALELAP